MSPYTIIYFIIAYKLLTTLILPWWIQRGSAKWNLRLKTFTANHDGKVIAAGKKKKKKGKHKQQHHLLFIAVPSSGAGRAMDLYDECIQELQKREENFTIEVHVTKSSDDVKNLVLSRDIDHVVSKYYGIIVLGGDSSITELIQAPLGRHGGRWMYPPILHLPGGSTNLLSKELHGRKSHKEILRQFSADKVRRAGVIKLSSTDGDDDNDSRSSIIYATHVAFNGIGRHMLVEAEQHRHGMYSVFGTPALMSIILKTIFSPPNKDETPYFALLIASTTNFAGGMDSGFGMDLFDDKLVMLHAKQYNGPFRYIKELMINMGTGELARQYFTSTLPEGVEVKIGEKFTFQDHDFHFILDGTSTVSKKGRSVTVESVQDSIPYFVI